MDHINSLRQLMDEYIAFSLELRRKTTDLRSLFGPRTEEIEHPGHQEFDRNVENWVAEFVTSNPSQEELKAALELLLFCAKEQENQAPYWYLTAIQRHSVVLLPLLDGEHRTLLAKRFAAEYPPKRQVPSQTQIHRMLDPVAGGRRSILRRRQRHIK